MKSFWEVFPSLQCKDDMRALMEQVSVERISTTKARDFLRIYILSERLIEKKKIWYLEKEIKKQLFPQSNMVIKIYEKFHLSSQYTPEKLMQVYEKSILEELRDYSPVEYSIFRNASITYPDLQTVKVMLEDSVMAKGKADEVIRILDKILNERCGFSVHIETGYKEKKENTHLAEMERKVENRVAEIVAAARNAEGVEDAEGMASPDGNPAETPGISMGAGDNAGQKADQKAKQKPDLKPDKNAEQKAETNAFAKTAKKGTKKSDKE